MTSSYFQKGIGMSIKQKYLRDENGEVFSPITSVGSTYNDMGNDLSPSFMVATFSGDKVVNISAAWTNYQLPMETTTQSKGDSFSLKNGERLSHILSLKHTSFACSIAASVELYKFFLSTNCNFPLDLAHNCIQLSYK